MLSVETRESHSSSHARSIVTCSRRLPEFACRSRKPVTCLSPRRRVGRAASGLDYPRIRYLADALRFSWRAREFFSFRSIFRFFFFNLPPSQDVSVRAFETRRPSLPTMLSTHPRYARITFFIPPLSNLCSSLFPSLKKSARELVIWREWDLRAKWQLAARDVRRVLKINVDDTCCLRYLSSLVLFFWTSFRPSGCAGVGQGWERM